MKIYMGCLGFVIALLLAGCGRSGRVEAPVAEVTETADFAKESITKLKNLSSFRFRLEFSTKGGLLDMSGSFEGSYVFPDRRSVKGVLSIRGDEQKLDIVASGDREYHLDPKTRKWSEEPASQETCPLRQLERTVGLGGFEYAGTERLSGKPMRVFSFKPNLAFLDPAMEKELEGKMWVAEKSGLPAKAVARSSDGTISWTMLLFGFNSPLEIEVPVKRRFRATFVALTGDNTGLSRAAALVGDRLSLLGLGNVELESRIKDRFTFAFESHDDISDMIASICAPGSLSVRTAYWPEEPVSSLNEADIKGVYGEQAVLVFEQGNVARPLILTDRIISSGDIERSWLLYDEFSRPMVGIEIADDASERLKKATAGHVGKPLGFALDKQVLYAPVVRGVIEKGMVRIGGFVSVKAAKSTSVMLATDPLPVAMSLSSVEEAKR